MNRWTRANLLLGLLVATLLTLHLLPPAPTHPALTRLDEDRVTSVRVEQGNRLQLALQKGEQGWRLSHPRAVEARTERVRQLLAIARAPVQQAFPAEGDLARYGLDKPGAVLQLDQQRLAFGDRDPGQASRYVLADGEIRVIDDLYFNLLKLPASHFSLD